MVLEGGFDHGDCSVERGAAVPGRGGDVVDAGGVPSPVGGVDRGDTGAVAGGAFVDGVTAGRCDGCPVEGFHVVPSCSRW